MPSILTLLRNPTVGESLGKEAWNQVLRQARDGYLHARLARILERDQLMPQLPAAVQAQFQDALVASEFNQTKLRHEIRQIEKTLQGFDGPIVLLKGGAYLAAGLPPSPGRFASDLDIMVPEKNLPVVESLLYEDGWRAIKLDRYDQHYYRVWMHELPPLWHPDRRAVIDIHHTILPKTGRVRPNAALLIEHAQSLPGSRLRVLNPEDMVLHCVAHMIYSGTNETLLRDLVDFDALIRHFGKAPAFWDRIVSRAKQHDLSRALFYSWHLAKQLLETPIPSRVSAQIKPGWPDSLFGLIVKQALVSACMPHPRANSRGDLSYRVAGGFLFLRSHWLRMPPILLASHLAIKTYRRMNLTLERAVPKKQTAG